MLRTSKPKLELLQPLIFQSTPEELTNDTFNPEDDAKNRLIDISSEEIQQNFFEIQNNIQNKVKRQKISIKPKAPAIIVPKPDKNRVSVVENFTQSHRIWRKKSVRLLEQQPIPAEKPQYSKNQSSFIIFQNGYLNNFNSCEFGHASFGEGFNRTQKARPPRNIMSLIKRKNIASIKQQVETGKEEPQGSIASSRAKYKRNMSPTERITKSCEFKKDFQSISPIKITTNDKIAAEQNFLELRCTNPNFRNKKISNYIKMRASVVVKKDRPN